MEDLDGLNLEGLNADIKYYVDKEKMLPLKMTIDFGDSLATMLEDMEGAQSLEFKKAYMEVEYTGLNTVETIEVPQEVKDAAEEEEAYLDDELETDEYDPEEDEIAANENGEYVLYNEDQSASMTVGTPEGFEYSYSSAAYGSLYFYDNDSIDLGYFIYDDYTADDMIKDYEYSYEWMSAEDEEDYQNIVLGDVATVMVGDKEVSYRKLTYNYSEDYFCTDYIAWTIIDDVVYSVEIEVFEEDSTPIDDSIVTEMFSCINFDTTADTTI